MSSNWKLLVESWQKGNLQFEEIVTEAGLVNELEELGHFIREHPRQMGSFLCFRFSPFDWTLRVSWIDQESLKLFIYVCAFNLISKQETSRGLKLIKEVHGDQKVDQFKQETLSLALENGVRNQLLSLVKPNNLISNEDNQRMRNLMKLQRIYPVDDFEVALGKCQGLSKRPSSSTRSALSQMEALVLKFCGKSLKEEVSGVVVSPAGEGLWEEVRIRAQDWKDFTNDESSGRYPQQRQQEDSKILSNSPLFLKTAMKWIPLSEDAVNRILYEGEILYFHLTGSLPETGNSIFEDPVSKWKAQFQYRISHHLIQEAVDQLDNIPESCKSEGLLKVFRKRPGEQEECFTHPVETLSILLVEDCTTYGQYVLEEKLIEQGLWLKTEWASFEQWIQFLARTGLLFETSCPHENIKPILQHEVIGQWIIEFCVQNQLPVALELYLDHHLPLLDEQMIIKSTGNCHWAQWLLFSRNPEMKFTASVANAKHILQKQNLEFHSLSELFRHGSIYTSLATIAQSPVPLTQTLLLDQTQEDKILQSCKQDFPIAPISQISELESQFLDTFPETIEALKAVAVKGRYQGKMIQQDFENWKKLMFRHEVKEVNFLDMIDDYRIPEIDQLLKISIDSSIDLSSDVNQDTQEDAGYWEQQSLQKLDQWLNRIATDRNPAGLMIGISQFLSSGRPVAALDWYFTSKQNPVFNSSATVEQKTPVDCIEAEDLQFLEQITQVVGILSFKDPMITSSCLVFAGLCGFSPAKIKTDICALQKVEIFSKKQNQEMMHLATDLAQEVLNKSEISIKNQPPVFAEILLQLENAALQEIKNQKNPVFSKEQGNSADLEESIEVLLKWSLVHAFAKIHDLKAPKQLLEILAGTNNWILFLVEASFHRDHIGEVIELAEQHFSDPRLRHHVCLILRDPVKPLLSQNSQRFSEFPLEVIHGPFSDSPNSTDLFGILLEAENTNSAAEALLHWALTKRWRLLTIVAACYDPSCYFQCLIMWLKIGLDVPSTQQEGSTQNEGLLQDEGLQLMDLVGQYCSTGAYDELLKGMELFPARSSAFEVLKEFLIGLKFHNLHFLKFASLHFTEFKTQILSKGPDPEEATFIEKITKSACFAVLRNLDSIFETRTLLDLVMTQLEGAGTHLQWLAEIKTLKLTYHLLGDEGIEFIQWKAEDQGIGFQPSVDTQQVLEKLQKEEQWLEARQWAAENQLSLLNITTEQAEHVIQDWTELGLTTELLWEEINQLFLDFDYPALNAGLFYIQQASRNQQSLSEAQQDLLIEALSWLDGSKGSRKLECSETFIQHLRLVLYLMNSTEIVISHLPCENTVFLGKDRENCPAIQMILQPVLEHPVVANDHSRTPESSKIQSCILRSSELKAEEQEGVELLQNLIPVISKSAIEKTVKALLDSGHIDAAKSLAEEQNLPGNLEFCLVDTALTIVHECSSNQWTEETPMSPVLSATLAYLKNSGILQEQDDLTPQGVLDAVKEASESTGGFGICSKAASAFRASILLNLSCSELASHGLPLALELILFKGPEAFPIAQEFIKAFDFTPRVVAQKLAHAYLNTLMGMETTTRPNQRKLEMEANGALNVSHVLINESQICSDWVEIGNALMQLLVERHCALSAFIEADILVQSFKCYSKVGYIEGLDVLLDLAKSRIHQFSVDEKYEALVKVSVGICHFDGLMDALDAIIKNKKLDLLLQDNESHDPSIVSTLRSALLSLIHQNCPEDSQMLALTHRHFNMHVDVGHGLKKRAMKLLVRHILYGRPFRDAGLLQAMDLLIHAGAAYSSAECSISAAECGSLVALVAQQACFLDRQWVCLTETECKELLPELSDISSALLVARAYKFNSAQDWALTLWQHMVHVAKEFHNNKNPASGALTRAIESMGQYCKAVMKEIIFTEDHLDQIVQMYVAYPVTHTAMLDPVNPDVLARCLVKFLESIMDIRQRVKLCESLNGSYITSIGEYLQIFENSSDNVT